MCCWPGADRNRAQTQRSDPPAKIPLTHCPGGLPLPRLGVLCHPLLIQLLFVLGQLILGTFLCLLPTGQAQHRARTSQTSCPLLSPPSALLPCWFPSGADGEAAWGGGAAQGSQVAVFWLQCPCSTPQHCPCGIHRVRVSRWLTPTWKAVCPWGDWP